ncbi:MAG: hypothetical protein PVF82_01150 [Gammaproteobacteria bacterium]|jgi:hypothetical protein
MVIGTQVLKRSIANHDPDSAFLHRATNFSAMDLNYQEKLLGNPEIAA